MKPVLNLFHEQKNGRRFRNSLDTLIRDEKKLVGSGAILAASECISSDVLDQTYASTHSDIP
jgi:hypothetical protein